MERKIYEILGIKQYRKFVLFCKSKFNKLTKKEDNDNYFLRGYKKEDIIFLKESSLFAILYMRFIFRLLSV